MATRDHRRQPVKLQLAMGSTIVLLAIALPRRTRGEDLSDFKVMYYLEDDNRIKVLSPTVSLQKELTSTLTIRIDGIYNSISGATPTGAPASQPAVPAAVRPSSSTSRPTPASVPAPAPAPVYDDDGGGDDWGGDDEAEREDEGGDDRRGVVGMPPVRLPYWAKAGASPAPAPTPAPTPAPAPAPAPSSSSSSGSQPKPQPTPTPAAPAPPPAAPEKQAKVPKADFSDERYAGNVELIQRLGRHTLSGLLSYSTESDYDSLGLSLKDAIDFNQKNTTLLLGGAYTHDKLTPANGIPADPKDTVDAIVGLTQLLDPRSVLTIDLSLGYSQGLLTDPYKVVELNGQLVPEQRPDSKNKQIVFLSLAHYFPSVHGSVEGSYRYYMDSFGIDAHTVDLAWFQKLGRRWTLRPLVRFYSQSAADFYGVRFAGAPESYSSDYRVSALNSLGYGLKLVFVPNARIQFDAEYLRYEQSGTDGVTPDDAYPAANVFIVGARIWL